MAKDKKNPVSEEVPEPMEEQHINTEEPEECDGHCDGKCGVSEPDEQKMDDEEVLEPTVKTEGNETESLQRQIEELQTLLKRNMADFENFRKRSNDEKAQLKDHAIDTIVLDFLPVFDNLERALVSAQSEGASLDSIVTGLNGVMDLYKGLLEKHQIEKIDSIGKEFDATIHEALLLQEGDFETKTVTQEVEGAYLSKGRVIRTAKVAVGVPKEDAS